nr:Gag-Pol polyprotein [Tanacetum cinerariifolium]
METYKTVSQDIRDQLNAEAEAVQIILTRIDNDIYSTVDACPNACEMWKEIERFVTLVKQSQELKTALYHKLYDILKQHQNEVNEIRAERIARVANLLALVAQQQPVYNPQTHPTQYTQNSLTRSQQAATRNRGKAIDKEIDKLIALISLSFKKIYKPTNNNLRTSSNISRANQDNSPRFNRSTGYENQRIGSVSGARETVGSTVVQKSGIQCYNYKEFGHVAKECQKLKRVKDATYHRENMLLYKKEEAEIQLNAGQADWRDDTGDELEDQKLEERYMYMAKLQEVSPDVADSGPIFDAEPLQKISNDDHYNVFAMERGKVHIRVLIDFDATFSTLLMGLSVYFGLHIMRMIASLQLHGGSDLLTLLVCITSASSGKKGKKNYSSVRRYVADLFDDPPN